MYVWVSFSVPQYLPQIVALLFVSRTSVCTCMWLCTLATLFDACRCHDDRRQDAWLATQKKKQALSAMRAPVRSSQNGARPQWDPTEWSTNDARSSLTTSARGCDSGLEQKLCLIVRQSMSSSMHCCFFVTAGVFEHWSWSNMCISIGAEYPDP